MPRLISFSMTEPQFVDGSKDVTRRMGWLRLRQSAVAMAALDAGASDADRSFYEGKIAAASFFAKNFLPMLTSTRQVIEAIDNDIMELPEAAF